MLLSQLKYFQVVAYHEHISHAAEELCVAQPALSLTISKIEKELETRLFERKGRQIKLNDAGKRLLAYVDFIFEQLDEMEKELQKVRDIWENELTIAVSNSGYLNGWLQEFMLQNPGIRLKQKMLNEDQLIQVLLDETVDVVLGSFKTVPKEILQKNIIDDEYVIKIPKEHPLAKKEKIYFDDIKDERIVVFSYNSFVRIADQIFAQRECKPNIAFGGNQRMYSQIMYFNKGLSFDSRQMIYLDYLRAKKVMEGAEIEKSITVRSIIDLNCQSKISVCWKKNRELPQIARKFIEAMDQEYPNFRQDEEYLQKTELPLVVS